MTDSAPSARKTRLTFPCRFAIKALGHNSEGFEALVLSIVQKHAAGLSEESIRRRLSGGGKYLSVTVTITAQSQAQLDAIYLELNAHERVVMVL